MLRFVVHLLLYLQTNLFFLLYIPLRIYYKLQSPKRCPKVFDDILLTPAKYLAEKIRSQEVSSVFVVSTYIERAQKVDIVLNVIVQDRFDLAMIEAKNADELIQSNQFDKDQLADKFPLLGVPVSIKESIPVASMSNSAGSLFVKNNAIQDANAVKSLKDAGAIIFLVSNTPELCMNWETTNIVTGVSKNPYDSRRTPGGSSGGEAALLASCGSLVGLGSDLCGSLRIPAHFTGIYTHKPTPGLIPNENHVPSVPGDKVWHFAMRYGPMTRYAVDLPFIFDVLVSDDKKNLVNKEVRAKEVKVFYMFDCGDKWMIDRVDSQIKNAMKEVVNFLKSSNIFTQKVSIEGFKDQLDLSSLPLLSIPKIYQAVSYPKVSYIWETIRILCCCPRMTANMILITCIFFFYKLMGSTKRTEHNKKLLEDLKVEIEQVLQDDQSVLLYPTFPHAAGFHGQMASRALSTSYMTIFNVLGFPVTVVPIGQTSSGLPISMQIISKANNDRVCMTLARYLEANFVGWTPPPYN